MVKMSAPNLATLFDENLPLGTLIAPGSQLQSHTDVVNAVIENNEANIGHRIIAFAFLCVNVQKPGPSLVKLFDICGDAMVRSITVDVRLYHRILRHWVGHLITAQPSSWMNLTSLQIFNNIKPLAVVSDIQNPAHLAAIHVIRAQGVKVVGPITVGPGIPAGAVPAGGTAAAAAAAFAASSALGPTPPSALFAGAAAAAAAPSSSSSSAPSSSSSSASALANVSPLSAVSVLAATSGTGQPPPLSSPLSRESSALGMGAAAGASPMSLGLAPLLSKLNGNNSNGNSNGNNNGNGNASPSSNSPQSSSSSSSSSSWWVLPGPIPISFPIRQLRTRILVDRAMNGSPAGGLSGSAAAGGGGGASGNSGNSGNNNNNHHESRLTPDESEELVRLVEDDPRLLLASGNDILNTANNSNNSSSSNGRSPRTPPGGSGGASSQPSASSSSSSSAGGSAPNNSNSNSSILNPFGLSCMIESSPEVASVCLKAVHYLHEKRGVLPLGAVLPLWTVLIQEVAISMQSMDVVARLALASPSSTSSTTSSAGTGTTASGATGATGTTTASGGGGGGNKGVNEGSISSASGIVSPELLGAFVDRCIATCDNESSSEPGSAGRLCRLVAVFLAALLRAKCLSEDSAAQISAFALRHGLQPLYKATLEGNNTANNAGAATSTTTGATATASH